ncbi:unnamed protein product [Darwinula stevensoni]|uniref:Uncharacterized protein n=1 Tax=Darwinula stevensoni TaxID=69355 RepID=A0A7R8XCV8_9CRUS|nr:unnamed protein product [Darwinula stevensoni]CAG0892644.1 unnamed protein product [Darwinula stevensoni]
MDDPLVCYKCAIRPPTRQRGEVIPPCSQFSLAANFSVPCPFSSACFKKTISIPLPSGVLSQIPALPHPSTNHARRPDPPSIWVILLPR